MQQCVKLRYGFQRYSGKGIRRIRVVSSGGYGGTRLGREITDDLLGCGHTKTEALSQARQKL